MKEEHDRLAEAIKVILTTKVECKVVSVISEAEGIQVCNSSNNNNKLVLLALYLYLNLLIKVQRIIIEAIHFLMNLLHKLLDAVLVRTQKLIRLEFKCLVGVNRGYFNKKSLACSIKTQQLRPLISFLCLTRE